MIETVGTVIFAFVGIVGLATFWWLSTKKAAAIERLFPLSAWPAEAGDIVRRSPLGEANLNAEPHIPVRLVQCSNGWVLELAPLRLGSGSAKYLFLPTADLFVVSYPHHHRNRRSNCCGMFSSNLQLFVYGEIARFVEA